MALLRWDPFTALARLDPEFDELVRRTWGSVPAKSGEARGTAGYVPAIEMVADSGDVLITLELPGVDVNDVDIEVTEGRLTVSGQRQEQVQTSGGEDGKVLVREFRYGSFRREFALPPHVTPEDVAATYDKGLLQVRVRNVAKPEAQPRRIQIQSTGEQGSIEANSSSS